MYFDLPTEFTDSRKYVEVSVSGGSSTVVLQAFLPRNVIQILLLSVP